MSGEPVPTAEPVAARQERVRRRVHELAAASGIPGPLPDTTEAPTGPDDLDWALASALAQHTSRTVRRRSGTAWGSAAVVALAEMAWAASGVFGLLDGSAYDRPITLGFTAFTMSAPFGTAHLFRRWHRARDAAALDVLAAAGRDPVTVVRQVFRDPTPVSRWKHLVRIEPTDQERIAAAERRGSRPAPPLH